LDEEENLKSFEELAQGHEKKANQLQNDIEQIQIKGN
jgi:hypothetical protein